MKSIRDSEAHFRRRLRAAREHMHLTQAQVADTAGIERQAYARIENDPDRRIRLGEAVAIVAALRGDLANFLSDEPIRLVTEIRVIRP
jgi:DNA-binding XRE family transcriptional regulator